MPVYIAFCVLCRAHSVGGSSAVFTGVCLAGVLLAVTSPVAHRFRFLLSSPCAAGMMLAGALTVTVMQTDNYFGIGAVGNTVKEMLTDYVSRGFHPNWRGILYGTIVMVVMITFPRKFKKASLYVRPAFLALLGTLVLNIFLNPTYMPSAIDEAGSPAAVSFPIFSGDFDFSAIPYGILCGAALWILLTYIRLCDEKYEKTDMLFAGAVNVILSVLPGAFYPAKKPKKYLPVIVAFCICAALSALMLIPLSSVGARMPVASCAVVLIVGAWQAVKWSKLKRAFSSPCNIAFFTVTVLLTLLTDVIIGTTVAALLSFVFTRLKGCEALPNE